MKRRLFSVFAVLLFSLLLSGTDAHAQSETPQIELGVQFSTLVFDEPDFFDETRTEPGFGARLTFNVNDNFALEAEGNFFPRSSRPTSTSGGRALQGQFGVKAGKRYEKFGIFAKARPGFVTFGNVFTPVGFQRVEFEGQPFFFPDFKDEVKTHFSTDVGGVIEFYPSRRIVTRFDFGDTIIRYGDRPGIVFISPSPGQVTPMIIQQPGETKHNFQFSAGVGFRF